MRRLLLLRHAKTERPEPGQRDRDRKLMPRGRSDAPIIGAYMVRHRLVPDLVLVSPATRAQETWTLVAPVFSTPPRVAKEDRIYNASTDTLAEIIRETHGANALLLVGHNPGFHDLATQLVGSGDADAIEHLSEKLPTSGLVALDFPFDDWAELQPATGRLTRYVSPRLIAEADD
jgi:phosphohistidine phosphatase